MNRAVTVVVVTDRAVEQMIAENSVESLSLRLTSRWRIRDDTHSRCNGSSACPDKTAVNFYHTGVARLDWAKLRVITNLRHFAAATVDDINKMLAAKDRQSAGSTAPAHGLYLQWIRTK